MSKAIEHSNFNETNLSNSKSKNMFITKSARVIKSNVTNQSKAFYKTVPMSRRGNMFAKQLELPHLPVPPLQQSLSKYLLSVKCLVDDNDFNITKRIAEKFGEEGGIGEMLQEKLIERSRVEVNWISKWWDNSAYFDFRMPVVVHSSPAIAFPKETFADSKDQLRYAARAIRCVINFKNLVESESVPVDMLGPHPMCMIQYNNLLSTCRIPHTTRDWRVKAARGEDHHIIVIHRNNFYSLNLYRNGQPISESEILYRLVQITSSPQTENARPVGILTSDGRTQWANARQRLLKDSQNKANLESIEKSMFVLCLDESPLQHPSDQEKSLADPDYTVTSREMLHGGGIASNSGNRWFDKIFQLIVGRDGHIGVCYEHSAAEAPPVIAVCNYIHGQTGNFRDIQPNGSNDEAPVKLEWNINSDTLEDINIAIEHLDSLVDDVELKSYIYKGYGKELIKKHKMSPDAFVQLIMHLSYYKLHRLIPPTYESAGTRMFQLGRTDTIRTASLTSKAFVEAMVDPDKSKQELAQLFCVAVKAHSKYTKEACNGEAFDRHFFGLKMIAVESGMDLPEFFMDKTFGRSVHFNMSTSQIGSKYDLVTCYGPAVPDGYGISYNPQSNCIRYTVSALNSNAQTNAVKMGDTVQQSFDEIGLVLSSSHL